MPFKPRVSDSLILEGISYTMAEHPAAPGRGMVYAQQGREATVYQLLSAGGPKALKVFKPAYRDPSLVLLSQNLEGLARLPGLQVCHRTVLTPEYHLDLLRQHPDLIYGVLMPWVDGISWFDLLGRRRTIGAQQSLQLAASLASTLSSMEQRGVAHCDLSAANLLLPGLEGGGSGGHAELVDVDQMHLPGLRPPDRLPAGSIGYAHKTARAGIWCDEADRFAGALLLSEILGWCDRRVVESSSEESYFEDGETLAAEDTAHYRLLCDVVRQRWGDGPADLLERAWRSTTLRECPTFGEWLLALPVAGQPSVAPTPTLSPPQPMTSAPYSPPGAGAPYTPPPPPSVSPYPTGQPMGTMPPSTPQYAPSQSGQLPYVPLPQMPAQPSGQAPPSVPPPYQQRAARPGVRPRWTPKYSSTPTPASPQWTPPGQPATPPDQGVSPWKKVLIIVGAVAALWILMAVTAKPSAPVPTASTARPTVASASPKSASLSPSPTPDPGPQGLVRLAGPSKGEMKHVEDTTGFKVYPLGQVRVVANFLAEARFSNPYDGKDRKWDYGFIFRDSSLGNHLRLRVGSDKSWSLVLSTDEGSKPTTSVIARGSIPDLDVASGGNNYLRLLAQDSAGVLYLNGRRVATLDLSRKISGGSVGVATGLNMGNQTVGKSTGYDQFSIWALPGVDPQPLYRAERTRLSLEPASSVASSLAVGKFPDFVADAKFTNPHDAARGLWDYGFIFRNDLRLMIYSDKTWHLIHDNRTSEPRFDEIASGSIENLAIGERDTNRLHLVCLGDSGLLYVNDRFVATLDLSKYMSSGSDLSVASGFTAQTKAKGEYTVVDWFSAWPLQP